MMILFFLYLVENNLRGGKTIDHCFLETISNCFYCPFYCFLKTLGGQKSFLLGRPHSRKPAYAKMTFHHLQDNKIRISITSCG